MSTKVERTLVLAERLLAGRISDAEVEELGRLLREDAGALDAYIRFTDLHGTLASHPDLAAPHRVVTAYFAPAPRPAWLPWALAACMAVLLTMTAVWLRQGVKEGPRVAVTGVSDPYLAIVIDQSGDAKWSGKESPRGLGHALGRGLARLESGEATLQLDNGVELQLRGPAELEMLSVDHGMLHRGQLSARVPEGAIGFRVDAPGVNVVDLGTEFSLALDGSGQPKVHVFKGKVRAGLPSMPDSRTELNTGESARFDVALGRVSRGVEDPALFPALENDALVPRTTGDVRYLRRAPESVKAGTFEHDSIMVFEEQAEFALPEELQVIRGASNQQEGPEPSVPELVTVPAGTRVRSYYVHFDRVGRGESDVQSKGSITFDRPVLGLVISLKTLEQTDAWLARAGTSYASEASRTLEMRILRLPPNRQSGRFDEVHLSPDGRTVTMDLLASWAVDQFRVLVAVE